MVADVHSAGLQDRDGGALLVRGLHKRHPGILNTLADGGYRGSIMADAIASISPDWRIEIIKRNELHRFTVLPKRWIVERTFAWLGRCRRLSKDFENLSRNALAFLHWASIRLMVRKLCNHTK